MNTPPAVSVSWDSPEPAALPLPPELPPLPLNPRVLILIDGDCVSRGLVEGTARGRACDHEVRACLDRVHATATLLDPYPRTRCAVSSATATSHFSVMASASNNVFAIRFGLDGADFELIDELNDLIHARSIAARPGRKRRARLADLVILVGHDGIYAPPVRQLRLGGTPTWLLAPGYLVARSLRRAASAVTYIGPTGARAA
jgi:hypothetical protein